MCGLAPLLCHLSRNTPIQDNQFINFKMKGLCASSKSPPQPLIGCCTISDGENKNNSKGREEEGSPARSTLRKYTFLTGRDEGKGETIKGTGGGREFARVITHLDADADGGRHGTLNVKSRGQQH